MKFSNAIALIAGVASDAAPSSGNNDARFADLYSEIAALKSKVAQLEAVTRDSASIKLRRRSLLTDADDDVFGLHAFSSEMSMSSSTEAAGMRAKSGGGWGTYGPKSAKGTYRPKSGKGTSTTSTTNSLVTKMCWSDKTKPLTVRIEEDVSAPSGDVRTDSFDGSFDFTTLTVGVGQDVIIDVTATTGAIIFTGNGHDLNKGAGLNLAENVGGDTGCIDSPANWNSVNEGKVVMGVELTPSGGGTPVNPVPQAMIELRQFEDVFVLDADDFGVDDDGFFFQNNSTMTNSGRFLFPGLVPGDYDVTVRVLLYVGTELWEDSDSCWTTHSQIVLGPHTIVASVIDAEDNECEELTEIRRR